MTEVIRGLTAEQCVFTVKNRAKVEGLHAFYVILNLKPNPNNTVVVTPISGLTLRTVKKKVSER